MDVTATPEEQEKLKLARKRGEVIEAKGRESVHISYRWAIVENPRWDFHNNYYRIVESFK